MKTITILNANKLDILSENKKSPFDYKFSGPEEMEASDGYHTFGELYEHRITLFIALCRTFSDFSYYNCDVPDRLKATIWRSKRHSDGELSFGGTWFVLGIGKEKGKQITYHLPIEKWEETNFAGTLEQAPEFDGHTPADVLERLKSL